MCSAGSSLQVLSFAAQLVCCGLSPLLGAVQGVSGGKWLWQARIVSPVVAERDDAVSKEAAGTAAWRWS